MVLDTASGQERGERASGIAAGLVAIALVLLAGRLGWLEAGELAVYDRFIRATMPSAPSHGSASASPVVLLSLGEADFARYGHPIPDALLADGLARLAALGASAIGVDLYRVPPAVAGVDALAGWSALSETVARYPQIVVAELLASEEAPGMLAPRFVPAAQVGFNNMLVDPGRVVRRGYLYAWDDDGTAHVSLALRLASRYLAARGVEIGSDAEGSDVVRIGATPLPPLESHSGVYADLDAGGYQIALDFRRDAADFESLRLEDLLEDRLAPSQVAGRVVVVGTDAPSVKDDFNTALAPDAVVKGLRLHAQLADQLIRAGLAGDTPPRAISEVAEAGLVGGLGGLAIAVVTAMGSLGRVVPALVVGLLLPLLLAAALFAQGVVVPSVAPALAWAAGGGASLALRARSEARARHQLVSLFRRFSSSKVADALWRERDIIMKGGRPRPRRVVLTSLMSDLEGFTTAAEKLEPEALLAWIDEYMNAMARVIEAHGGHVDDYVGDGIKANFGVPIPSETPEAIARDAQQAVDCALAMERALEACNRSWARKGLPLARQRIGIETGPAVVGAIGSDARMKYTSVGDTINTASRLESFAEPEATGGDERQARILVGEATRRLLGDRFVLEDRGSHNLKGKSERVRIHRVLGLRVPPVEEGRS